MTWRRRAKNSNGTITQEAAQFVLLRTGLGARGDATGQVICDGRLDISVLPRRSSSSLIDVAKKAVSGARWIEYGIAMFGTRNLLNLLTGPSMGTTELLLGQE